MITLDMLFGLTESHLTTDESGEHLVHKELRLSFQKLQTACLNHGVSCDIASSYRSLPRQLSIWQRKWSGELPIRDLAGEPLLATSLSDESKANAILTWSALPGASRHHWGTDIDVYDKQSVEQLNWSFELTTQEYEIDGPCHRLNQFLSLNLSDFGFYRPYAKYTGGIAQEPWHISYKPLSQLFENALTPEHYYTFLKNLDFSGKHYIMANFDTLFERFVLNKGMHP